MPEDIEYLHCVQPALDSEGLRCQVLDSAGRVRERLSWPVCLPSVAAWHPRTLAQQPARVTGGPRPDRVSAFRFTGVATPSGCSAAQTLLCAYKRGELPNLWIGLRGPGQMLTVILHPEPGRSPHYWSGPALEPGSSFDLQLLLHAGMGPGGIMLRIGEDLPWTSLSAASPWGAERVAWPKRWSVGFGPNGFTDCPFAGTHLEAASASVAHSVSP
jgi:hypothetical protein